MGKGEAVGLEAAPYCRAPELLKHGVYSTATDIYALGMLMYESLYRREPFAGEATEVCCSCLLRQCSVHLQYPDSAGLLLTTMPNAC